MTNETFTSAIDGTPVEYLDDCPVCRALLTDAEGEG